MDSDLNGHPSYAGNQYGKEMIFGDGTTYWHSAHASGGWVRLSFPTQKLLSSVILTRRSPDTEQNTLERYGNLCLYLNGESTPILCTDKSGGGAPLLVGNEIHFDITPTVASMIEIKFSNNNYAQVAGLELAIQSEILSLQLCNQS